jgi:Flp pilus assembly protein CpaB
VESNEVQKEADTAGRMGLLFGLGAMILAVVFGYMLAHLSSGGPETKPVVVANTTIPPLSQPKIDQLRVVEWPTAAMPKGTFQRSEDVIKTGLLNINGMLEGEPVLAERLSTPDKGLGMSQLVEPNKRAFVVQVQDSLAIAEILHPGAVVDVVATLTDNKTRESVTKVLMQNIGVAAVGDSIDVERNEAKEEGGNENKSTRLERHRVVTLMVSLPQVELLVFATRNGAVDLSLRNNTDDAIAATSGITMDKIVGRRKMDDKIASPAEAPEAASSSAAGLGASINSHLPRVSRPHNSAPRGPSIIKVNR